MMVSLAKPIHAVVLDSNAEFVVKPCDVLIAQDLPKLL
jgi:hypothetical protein